MTRVLSLVERGWRGARELSLALKDRGVVVTHLIKGRLSKEVREMIRPYPSIRLVDVPKAVFPLACWAWVVTGGLLRRAQWVLVDRDRTASGLDWWCAVLRIGLVRIEERGGGFVVRLGERTVTPELWLGGFPSARDGPPEDLSPPQAQNTSLAAETGANSAFHNTGRSGGPGACR